MELLDKWRSCLVVDGFGEHHYLIVICHQSAPGFLFHFNSLAKNEPYFTSRVRGPALHSRFAVPETPQTKNVSINFPVTGNFRGRVCQKMPANWAITMFCGLC